MLVPIKNLQLHDLLHERVYIKWEDKLGRPSTLGSCLNDNKQNTKLVMKAVCDSEGHIHIHFSLLVTIKVVGKLHQMEMLLVVPPDFDFEYASKPRQMSTLDDLSFLDASALHEAGISDIEQIIVLPFDLDSTGFVVTKKKDLPTIRPSTRTSSKLIRSLESLSLITNFKVYIRPSDYARQGLKELYERLSTGTRICKSDMMELYVQQDIMLVDWTRFKHHELQDTILPPVTENPIQRSAEVQIPQPPYTENSAQRSAQVQIPQNTTLPQYTENSAQRSVQVQLPQNTTLPQYTENSAQRSAQVQVPQSPSANIKEVAIPETPSSVPVLHGIFSSDSEEPSDVEVDLDLWNFDEDSGHIETNLEAGSEALKSEIAEWLNAAMTINKNVHKHRRLASKLSTLGESARMSDAGKFDTIRSWCSALFFYDPRDSSHTSEIRDSTKRSLISDMAKLIIWVNTFHRGAEMSLLMDDFLKLGSAVRGCDTVQYMHLKSDCIARTLVEFGKSGTYVSRVKSKVLSRKRNIGETGSDVSKRARTVA